MGTSETVVLINQLLNEADAAMAARQWTAARIKARAVLSMDTNNGEAQSIMEAVEAALNAAARERTTLGER